MKKILNFKKYQRILIDMWTRMRNLKINFRYLFLDIFLIFIIISFTYNIYNSYNKGVTNLEIVAEEQAELVELQDEYKRLFKLKEYYSSMEYKKAYARESLNLAEPDEQLYAIKRDEKVVEEDKVYLTIEISDNMYWWKRLIFGG